MVNCVNKLLLIWYHYADYSNIMDEISDMDNDSFQLRLNAAAIVESYFKLIEDTICATESGSFWFYIMSRKYDNWVGIDFEDTDSVVNLSDEKMFRFLVRAYELSEKWIDDALLLKEYMNGVNIVRRMYEFCLTWVCECVEDMSEEKIVAMSRNLGNRTICLDGLLDETVAEMIDEHWEDPTYAFDMVRLYRKM